MARDLHAGVPVFRDPAVVKPDLPDEPEYKKIDNDIVPKKNEELDKLMAMAQAIGGDKKPDEKKDEKPAAGGGLSLDDLMKQAASISS